MSAKVLTIYGTRPEAIKLAPVIKALEAAPALDAVTLVTGQHRDMLDQVNTLFDIHPDYDLDIFEPGQGLNLIASKLFRKLQPVLAEVDPDAVLVQGDTSTVAIAAIAAFYDRIPVVHLEAGLRSGDLSSPFPEEANRKLTSQVASLHLAPTERSRANLRRENVPNERIVVTGNTVIDALLRSIKANSSLVDPRLAELESSGRRFILVTTHRRENWGSRMEGIGRALGCLAREMPDYRFVFPMHRNPTVREAIAPHIADCRNVIVTEPLGYGEFTRLLALSHVVLTDSGGVQEEAPSLGKPVLVLRDNTERPEAISAGTVKLVGTDPEDIFTEVLRLCRDGDHYDAMSNAVNPYGDGHAADRCVAAIAQALGVGTRLADFKP